MRPAAVRRLVASDLPALEREVARARAAGEFAPSSDADAAYFVKSVAVDPGQAGGAFDEAGALLGFVSPEFKVLVVRPDLRRGGIGRALVALGLEMEAGRDRPNLLLGALPSDAAARAFLEATGFAYHSTVWDLNLPAAAVVVPPRWPHGHAVRPFDRTRDTGPWIELFNAAFADHATPLQLDEASVIAGFDDPSIADSDTLLVEDVGAAELVAFCATAPERHDGMVGTKAEIWTIGVRPDRQGRGLGRQLLRWGVEYLRALGVGSISLSVNARNERALALYESEGFVVARGRDRWATPVTARAGVTRV